MGQEEKPKPPAEGAPQEEKKVQPVIIIKKRRPPGEEEAHGGAWKVAYADFMTAMMAFFLVMWLVTMVSKETRSQVASYFKHFNILKGEKKSSGPGGPTEQLVKAAATEPQISALPTQVKSMTPDELKDKLRQIIEERLKEFKDQIIISTSQEGVRIEIVDSEGNPIFALGSSALNPNAKMILGVLNETIKELENKIVIEGHTDSLTYPTGQYTNWELSTDRASETRKEFEYNGLNPEHLSMVAGYAATRPLIKEDSRAPQNRRISIVVLYPQAAPAKQEQQAQPEQPAHSAEPVQAEPVQQDEPKSPGEQPAPENVPAAAPEAPVVPAAH